MIIINAGVRDLTISSENRRRETRDFLEMMPIKNQIHMMSRDNGIAFSPCVTASSSANYRIFSEVACPRIVPAIEDGMLGLATNTPIDQRNDGVNKQPFLRGVYPFGRTTAGFSASTTY